MTLPYVVFFLILGLLMNLLSGNAKVQDYGRIVFACSFLAWMIDLSSKTLKLP